MRTPICAVIAVIGLMLFCGGASRVYAEQHHPGNWGRDPFESVDRVKVPEAADQAEKEPVFWLTGIFSRQGRHVAIVNRIFVRDGDAILGARVKRIAQDRVFLEKDGKEIILRMGGV